MKNMNQESIKKIIPHRYENLLLDEEDIFEENGINKGKFRLSVSSEDPHSRQVFMRKSGDQEVFIEPTYMEILALGSIVSMGELPEGVTAFFSAITNYKKTGDIALGQVLLGDVEKGKAKGDFHRFSGRILSANGDVVAEGDLMAFAMKASDTLIDVDKKQIEVPANNLNHSVDKSRISWKRSDLIFADTVYDQGENWITTAYTYPQDHIFTKGHFPGNPVMMGINQWIAGADAAYLFLDRLALSGKLASGSITLTCDVELMKSDGVVTSEIKGLVCSATISDGQVGPMSVDATKKLYFRDVVKPLDQLIISAKNIVIS